MRCWITVRGFWATRFAAGLSAAISASLRFPLQSLSPPLAGARCALRLPKSPTRRADVPDTVPDSGRCTSCLAGVRTSADTTADASGTVLRTTPHSTRCTSARSSAAAASTCRGRPRRFHRRSFCVSCRSGPPGAALGLTPHAAGCGCAPFALLACPRGHFRRLWAPRSCWSERVTLRHPRSPSPVTAGPRLSLTATRPTNARYTTLMGPLHGRFTPRLSSDTRHPARSCGTITARGALPVTFRRLKRRLTAPRVRHEPVDLVATATRERAIPTANPASFQH